jgi:hypothetical protein
MYLLRNRGIFAPLIQLPISTDGLLCHLDAANPLSYPGSGSQWTDISGNQNNATLNGTTSWNSSNSGRFNISFGTNNYITVNNSSDFDLSQDFTFEQWFFADSAMAINNTYYAISATDDGGTRYGTGVWRSGLYPGRLYNVFQDQTGFGTDGSSTYTGSAFVVTNRWNRIAYTKTGTSYQFWLNGSLWVTKTMNNVSSGANAFLLGKYSTSTFQGAFSIFSYYNRVLTSAEMMQSWDAYRGRYGI